VLRVLKGLPARRVHKAHKVQQVQQVLKAHKVQQVQQVPQGLKVLQVQLEQPVLWQDLREYKAFKAPQAQLEPQVQPAQ